MQYSYFVLVNKNSLTYLIFFLKTKSYLGTKEF